MFYFISSAFVLISFLLIPKSKDKLNVIHWIVLTLFAYWSYLSLSMQLLSIAGINFYPNTIIILNIITAMILGTVLLIKKNIQKYYVAFNSVYCIIILIIIAGYFAIRIFGKRFGLWAYVSGDSANHMQYMLQFCHDGFTISQCFHAVACGWMFTCLNNYLPSSRYYQFFICQDILFFVFQGILFWIMIKDYIFYKKTFNYVVSSLLFVLFLIGWPLNNMVMGFEYWGTAITLILGIIQCCYFYQYNKIDSQWLLLLLILFNYALAISYILFFPIILCVELIFFAPLLRKILNKLDLKVILTVVCIITILLVAFYMIFIKWFGGDITFLRVLSRDGNSYRGNRKDFLIFFIPYLATAGYFAINRDINNIVGIFASIVGCGELFLWGLNKAGFLSDYYFSKFDYLLWLVCFLNLFFVLQFEQSRKIWYVYSILGFAVILGFLWTGSNKVLPVYQFNLYDHKEYVSSDEMTLYRKAGELYEKSNEDVAYIGKEEDWVYTTFYCVSGQKSLDSNQLPTHSDSQRYYCVLKERLTEIGEQYTVIFENSAGSVIQIM